MSDTFHPPVFVNGDIEFRYADDEIVVYATPEGLRRLASLCNELADKAIQHRTAHRHLEDLNLLTPNSLNTAIAVFRD